MHLNLKRISDNIRLIGLFLLDIGIDVRKLIYLKNIFKYLKHYIEYKKKGGAIDHKYIILSNYGESSGIAKGHYFHQDLLVASFIYKAKPVTHIDIGSRVDGFVAHVASFRKIKIYDIRELEPTGHDNIIYEQLDILNLPKDICSVSDSISCLHVIEHIGLGRYGDTIDPIGHIKAINNLIRLLKNGGVLYLSFPIATIKKVYFNAHRVFEPFEILAWIDNLSCRVERFDYVDDEGKIHLEAPLGLDGRYIKYGCGIYTIRKHN